ncbi:MAG: ATP synthase subunit I [Hyphomicrobiales bacterium]
MLVRLEMDEERMTLSLSDALPTWAELLGVATHLAAGIILGILYFRSLWWSVCRLAGGGRVVTTIALTISRFVFLGGLLTLASLEGALPLLALALGVLIARSTVMRRVREATP